MATALSWNSALAVSTTDPMLGTLAPVLMRSALRATAIRPARHEISRNLTYPTTREMNVLSYSPTFSPDSANSLRGRRNAMRDRSLFCAGETGARGGAEECFQ